MQVFFTVPNSEGKARYGEDFENYELIVVYHCAKVGACAVICLMGIGARYVGAEECLVPFFPP